MSLKRDDDGSPWSLCRRPWTVMYFTANGRALPCCIAPFSQRGYENYTLGDATQQTLARDLERPGLPARSARRCCPTSRRRPAPAAACAGACEPVPRPRVALVIPTLNEEDSIGDGGARDPARRGGPGDRRRRRQHATGPASAAQRGRRRGDRRRPRLRPRLPRGDRSAATDADIIVFMDGDGADDPGEHRRRWSRRSARARTIS